jgi:hypothetical protein
MNVRSGMGSRSLGIEDGQDKIPDRRGISLNQRRRIQMKTTVPVSHPSTRLMWAGVLIAAFLIAGCTTVVPCSSCQPQCSSGGGPGSTPDDPVTCVPVPVASGDGSGCTSGERCSSSTANKSCPFNWSVTKCRTMPHTDGTAGKCMCKCAS